MRAPERFDVAVAGGSLHVGRWGTEGPVVLAIHGITASMMEWPGVAEQLPDVRLVAPDLRGRGGSSGLPGPFGMRAHCEDLIAVLDHIGEDRVTVVGHSMGGYVAATFADLFPDRLAGLVLVDGGVKLFDLPPDVDVDAVLAAVIGPAMERLRTTFPSRDAYRDFWRAHPALRDDWSDDVQAYVDYDLAGDEPELRSRVSIEAVREDSKDLLLGDDAGSAVERLRRPAVFLRAERGMQDEPVGLYPDEAVKPRLERAPMLRDVVVPGVNHYTIVISERGAKTVAQHVREAIDA